jgi:hypothetical protein
VIARRAAAQLTTTSNASITGEFLSVLLNDWKVGSELPIDLHGMKPDL